MALETVRLIEGVSTNPDLAPFKRAFAAGVLLMTYASLRFFGLSELTRFRGGRGLRPRHPYELQDKTPTRPRLAVGMP